MPSSIRPPPKPIFVIRLWQELPSADHDESADSAPSQGANQGSTVWRGEIKNIATGEVRYFSTWERLADLVPMMLANDDRLPSEPP